MKKPLLLFAALAAAAAPLSSDNPEKTPATVRSPKRITGSRAGLNAAWTTAKAEGISANTPDFPSAHIGRFGDHHTAQPFGGIHYAFGFAGKCFGK